jgi:ectoine hydroxylase-related dioxygenase (phytanoyl-CoA dioxygenase family)
VSAVGAPPFAPVGFGAFHADVVPGLLAEHAAVVAHRPDDLAPLTLEVGDEAVTYGVAPGGVEVVDGVQSPRTHVRLDPDAWSDFAHELRSAFGLGYAQLADCVVGRLDGLSRWEATLRAAWTGRDPALPDVEPCAPDAPLAEQLALQGFALVPDVFSPDEVATLRAEATRLTEAARPDDHRSWWARTGEGDDVCCRLLYTDEGSDLITELVTGDERLADLVAATGEQVRLAVDRFDGLSVVMKPPGVVEGLADLPWHRDCGLGGHSVMCPEFNVGIQLEAATAETGHLEFLPGSHASGWWPRDPHSVDGRTVVAVDTEPGDVTIHYGHVLHRAGSPTGIGGRRALYATFVQDHAFDYVGPRQAINDVLFASAEGGVLDDRGTAG